MVPPVELPVPFVPVIDPDGSFMPPMVEPVGSDVPAVVPCDPCDDDPVELVPRRVRFAAFVFLVVELRAFDPRPID